MKRTTHFPKSLLHRFLPYAAIFLLWFIFIWPYIGRGLVPVPSSHLVSFFPPWNARYAIPVRNGAMPDVVNQIIPWKILTASQWREGSAALWNPYAFSGTPHAANYQSAVFSPVNFLYIVFPFLDAWSISVVLQPLFAGLFMVLLLGRFRLSPWARIFGGIGFMFCSLMVTWMAYGTLGYAALVMPVAFWGALVYRDTGSRTGLAALSFSLAFSFVSGHFQIALYTAGATLLWIWFLFRSDRRKLSVAMVSFAGGVLIAGVQLAQTVEAYLLSQRVGDFRITEIIPWSYFPTLFAPDYFGNPVTGNDWYGHYAEWGGYAGIVTMCCMVYALVRSKFPERKFFIVLGMLALLSAYRTPLQDIIRLLHVPVLSTSAASRILFITSFSIVVIGAFGFDSLIHDVKQHVIRWRALAVIPLFLGLFWLVTLLPGFPEEAVSISRRNLVLPTLLTAIMCCGVAITGKFGRFIPVFAGFLLLLSSFDMWRYASKWMPFEPRDYVYPPDPVIGYLVSTAVTERVFGNLGGEVGTTYGLQFIEGYDAMYMKRYGELVNGASATVSAAPVRSVVAFDKHGAFRDRLLQLLGVRYVVHRKSDARNVWAFPYWEYEDSMILRYSDDAYEVYEYADVFPRAFLAQSFRIPSSGEDTLTLFRDSDIDLRNTVILEDDPGIQPVAGGEASIIRYEPDEVKIGYVAQGPSLLVLTDSFHPGWKAQLDEGQPLEVLRAYHQLRAVAVPEGSHTVTFRFRPDSYLYGLFITITGIIVSIGVLIKKKV